MNQTTRRVKPKKSGAMIFVVILVIILFVMNAGLITMQVLSNLKLSKYIDDDRKYNMHALEDGGYIEDGFFVGEMYEIRSTKAISDAYIKGDTSSLSTQELETYNLASAVIDEVITDGMSNYEKEDAIYTWMCENIETSEGSQIVPGLTAAETVSTPYGVLSGKKSVCVGYATTMRMFMQMLGVDCHIVHNDYHSWDLVQMDDGSWYHTDVYMDSESGSHASFNMNDAMCREGHDWNDYGYLPAADATSYCYAYKNSVEISDFSEIPQAIFDRGTENHESYSLYFRTGALSDTENYRLYTMLDYISELFSYCIIPGTENAYFNYSLYDLDENTKIIIAAVYDSTEAPSMPDDPDFDPEAITQELSDMLNGIFGIDYQFGGNYYDDGGYYDEVGDLIVDEDF